jgi:hypothetical protein
VLGASELAGEESNMGGMLLDDGSKLVLVGGNLFNIEQFIWIEVSKEYISHNHCFDCIESDKLGLMPTFTEKFVRL